MATSTGMVKCVGSVVALTYVSFWGAPTAACLEAGEESCTRMKRAAVPGCLLAYSGWLPITVGYWMALSSAAIAGVRYARQKTKAAK